MDMMAVAFSAMGICSIAVLALHSVKHKRRLQDYREQLMNPVHTKAREDDGDE